MSETPLELLVQGLPAVQSLVRLEEQVTAQTQAREHMLAEVFELGGEPCPSWARPLPDGRAVQFIGGTRETREQFSLAEPGAHTLVFEHKVTTSTLYRRVVEATHREIAAYGARGDRKTTTLLHTILGLAERQAEDGAPLPFIVYVISATHAEHRRRLVETVQKFWWGGIWALRDDAHVVAGTVGGREMVRLVLVGVEDMTSGERAKFEAHAVWFEEPQPAWGLDVAGGVTEEVYSMAQTGLRLPGARHPVLVTSNQGAITHWCWQRFGVRVHPGTCLVRIQPGEWATAEERARWEEACAGLPNLIRTLIHGEPGALGEGPAVADGFNAEVHVSRTPLRAVEGVPLVLGHDGGHTPATVLVQLYRGEVRVLGALPSARAGTRQHVELTVRPWLALHAPWALAQQGALLRHFYDPSMATGEQGDIDQDPVRVLRETLGGMLRPGAQKWPPRLEPMLALFYRLNPDTGRASLQIDPTCTELLLALSGAWYYPTVHGTVARDLPVKSHPHSDLGDALLYALGGLGLGRARDEGARRPPQPAKMSHISSMNFLNLNPQRGEIP